MIQGPQLNFLCRSGDCAFKAANRAFELAAREAGQGTGPLSRVLEVVAVLMRIKLIGEEGDALGSKDTEQLAKLKERLRVEIEGLPDIRFRRVPIKGFFHCMACEAGALADCDKNPVSEGTSCEEIAKYIDSFPPSGSHWGQ